MHSKGSPGCKTGGDFGIASKLYANRDLTALVWVWTSGVLGASCCNGTAANAAGGVGAESGSGCGPTKSQPDR